MKEERRSNIDVNEILANEELIKKLSAKVLDVIHGTSINCSPNSQQSDSCQNNDGCESGYAPPPPDDIQHIKKQMHEQIVS